MASYQAHESWNWKQDHGVERERVGMTGMWNVASLLTGGITLDKSIHLFKTYFAYL